MIAIIDYGVGNLFSLKSSFNAIGADITVTDNEEIIRSADKIILPGVGAFSDAIAKLRATGLDKVLIDEAQKGKPVMGICLGMQMLFEKSFEYGEYDGLGLLKGNVVGMQGVLPEELKIPHIGWNALHFKQNDCPLFKYIKENDCVYFVHSYFAEDCDESVAATTEYGKELTAAVAYKNIYGCQFHPEKSGEVGLNILRAFCETEAE
ncbi:MAG: imidazole glycerol phosphate synthase subunit HisH [Acutalibacteraceae bacterium]|jgi:glutamine amidotransferase|nr:imidazole glycerol phosphate synthase subunit HisH [Acutalibacteraceae bacterium]